MTVPTDTPALPTRSPPGALDLTPSAPLLLTPKSRTYTQQFANLYFNRLTTLRPHVHARAARKWHSLEAAGSATPVQRTLDIKPNALVWFIGTLYRDMPLKPSILDDVAAEYGSALPPPKREKIVSDADKVAIEDEYGRVVLEGEYLARTPVPLVTGVVAAVIGTETKQGGFQVVDMCFAGLPDPERPLVAAAAAASSSEWIALVSGLHFGSPESKPLPLVMLAHYLVGNLGSDDDKQLMAQVSRLFILGNSISAKDDDATAADQAYATLDAWLGLIAKSLPITLLPGPDDPATHLMPQQPMHKSLFATAAGMGDGCFKSVTNPLMADWNGNHLVLTSGQPLDDVYKYVDVTPSRLSLACHFLTWRHVAPTAPDTLWCYPYVDKDPFVLRQRPRVFAVGNQPQFDACLFDDERGMQPGERADDDQGQGQEQVRVVLVPEFRKTGQLVLVNVRTLEYHVVTLDVDDGDVQGGQAEEQQGDDADAMDTSE